MFCNAAADRLRFLMTKVTGHKGSTDHLHVPKIEVHKRITGKIRDIIACRTKSTTIKNIQKHRVKLKLRSRLKYTVFS